MAKFHINPALSQYSISQNEDGDLIFQRVGSSDIAVFHTGGGTGGHTYTFTDTSTGWNVKQDGVVIFTHADFYETDYTGLDNKPQINGIELIGNKTGDNLNLVSSQLEEDGEIGQIQNSAGAILIESRKSDFTGVSSEIGVKMGGIEMSTAEAGTSNESSINMEPEDIQLNTPLLLSNTKVVATWSGLTEANFDFNFLNGFSFSKYTIREVAPNLLKLCAFLDKSSETATYSYVEMAEIAFNEATITKYNFAVSFGVEIDVIGGSGYISQAIDTGAFAENPNISVYTRANSNQIISCLYMSPTFSGDLSDRMEYFEVLIPIVKVS